MTGKRVRCWDAAAAAAAGIRTPLFRKQGIRVTHTYTHRLSQAAWGAKTRKNQPQMRTKQRPMQTRNMRATRKGLGKRQQLSGSVEEIGIMWERKKKKSEKMTHKQGSRATAGSKMCDEA